MLPQDQMVRVRKALESSYNGICQITEYHKIKKANKSTAFQEVVVLENQPCRLSFKNITNASDGATASAITQVVKLFLPPDITVKAGSKITVTQNGVTTAYKASGQPAIYTNHQEIILELFDGWA